MNKYLPSAFEIEKPLRRDYIAELNRSSKRHWTIRTVALGILAVLLAILAYRTVMPVLSMAPAPEKAVITKNGKEVSLTTACAQYRNDELTSGQKMEQTTAKLCGFDNN
jgi:hypothetical protein